MSRTRQEGGLPQTRRLGVITYISTGAMTPVSHTHIPFRTVCRDSIHPRHPNEGGDFDLQRFKYSFQDAPSKMGADFPMPVTGERVGVYYTGATRAYGPPATLPSSTITSDSNYGAQGWARYSPLRPKVGLGQFLAELRSLPRDVKETVDLFRKFNLSFNPKYFKFGIKKSDWFSVSHWGKTYLLGSFGWRPFVKDLLAWIDSIRSIDKEIAKLRDQNGQWQKRGGTLFETTESQTSAGTANIIGTYPGYFQVLSRSNTVEVKDKVWFKGRFRYYIPKLDDPKWGKFHAARKLWDLEVSPHLVYELVPWTWLSNWFVDLDSVIRNLESTTLDHLAAKYAYIMHTRNTKTTLSAQVKTTLRNTYTGYKYTTITPSCCIEQETKTRIAASPFGFGLSSSGFSPFQLSILSALGISRLKF